MPAKHQAAQRKHPPRSRYAGTAPAAANDIPPGTTIVATAAQLSHLVRTEVLAALEESGAGRAPAGAPRQLTRSEIADALGVSVSTIDTFRLRGMPCRRVGDSPRYELQACLDWFDTDKAQDGA